MKLISLNTWGGKYFEPLIKFIQQHSADTDIFCLQEIYHTSSDIKIINFQVPDVKISDHLPMILEFS